MKFSAEKNLETNNFAPINQEINPNLIPGFKSLTNKILNEILLDFDLGRVKSKLALLSAQLVKENKLKINSGDLADFILQSALESSYKENGGFLKEKLGNEYFSLLFGSLKNKILHNNSEADFSEWSSDFRSELKILASELPKKIGLPATTIGEEAKIYLTNQEKNSPSSEA